MTPAEKLSQPVPDRDSEFWSAYPEIAWSNRHASDTVCIRAALMRPRFGCLLDVARRFGLDRLRTEWEILVADDLSETDRAEPHVERILRNIAIGFENTRARVYRLTFRDVSTVGRDVLGAPRTSFDFRSKSTFTNDQGCPSLPLKIAENRPVSPQKPAFFGDLNHRAQKTPKKMLFSA